MIKRIRAWAEAVQRGGWAHNSMAGARPAMSTRGSAPETIRRRLMNDVRQTE